MASKAKVRKRSADPRRCLEDDTSGAEDFSDSDGDSCSSGSVDSQVMCSVSSLFFSFHLPPPPSPATQEEIEVDFDVREIEEEDFHGIRRLLQQVLVRMPPP